jgi:hypothetical protein
MTRQIARPRAAAVTALLAVAALLVGSWAAPAEATSYRFWAYWLGTDDGWSFSSQGASRVPADGTVDGWRFAVSEASSSTIPPRHTPSFARICGSTEAVDGSKRVGVVVDFGSATDAPDGESPPAMVTACVVAEPGANGYDVLTEVVQIRTDAGLICGMDGYPAAECGAPVADPEPSPSGSPSGLGGAGGSEGGSGGEGGGTPDTSAGEDGSAGGGQGGQRVGDQEPSTADGDQDSGGKGGGEKKAGAKKADKPSDPTAPEASVSVSPAAAAAGAPAAPGGGSPAGLVAGLGVVAALLAAAVVLPRRRT